MNPYTFQPFRDTLLYQIISLNVQILLKTAPCYKHVFFLFVHVFLLLLDAANLTEVFPCFFLGCKANVRV